MELMIVVLAFGAVILVRVLISMIREKSRAEKVKDRLSANRNRRGWRVPSARYHFDNNGHLHDLETGDLITDLLVIARICGVNDYCPDKVAPDLELTSTSETEVPTMIPSITEESLRQVSGSNEVVSEHYGSRESYLVSDSGSDFGGGDD